MEELYPGDDQFKASYDISLRRPTNTAQKQSETLFSSVQQFHRYLRREATNKSKELANEQPDVVGPCKPEDIANMDQTPLQFCFNTKRETYAVKVSW